MRNLKRVLSLTLASVMLLGMMVVGAGAAGYSDVDYDNDNVEAIEVLNAVGVMLGDADGSGSLAGTFRPGDEVSRAEMAVIMAKLMNLDFNYYTGTNPFTDMNGHWAEGFAAACYANGIIAGRTSTTYDPNATVTTVEAAAMLMRALGYFQNKDVDYADGFVIATVRQAGYIDLFNGVDTKTNDPMTRNDVAQLVLNTLQSGMVEPDDGSKVSVTVGDAQVSVGASKYVYVTSRENYATAIRDDELVYYGATSSSALSAPIVELGEKLYQGDLTKRDAYRNDYNTDVFGRPANTWEYQAKEVGTYPLEPEEGKSFNGKVTPKKLYDAVGRTAAEEYVWIVTVDGVDCNVDAINTVVPTPGSGYSIKYGWKTLSDNKTDTVAEILDAANMLETAAGKRVAKTGNGTRTEVFVNGTSRVVHMSVTHYYAAEVYKVNSSDGTVSLSNLHSYTKYDTANRSDVFYTDELKEDDIVMYSYAGGKIQEIFTTERLEGNVARVRVNPADVDGDYFDTNGERYNYNVTVDSDARLITENVRNDMVSYLDQYGYCGYVDEEAVSYDYAYVLSMGNGDDQYGYNNYAGKTVYARLILTDGTMVKAETDVRFADLGNYENHLVSYTVDKNGVYTLAVRDVDNDSGAGTADYDPGTVRGTNGVQPATSKARLNIETGVASITAAGGTYTANSNTVFIVAESDTNGGYDDYDFYAYTGIKNVPDIEGISGAWVAVAADQNRIAKVVYVQDADVSGAADVIFVRADSGAKLVRDEEIGDFREIEAVMDGEAVTLQVKRYSSAETKLCTAAGIAANGANMLPLKEKGQWIAALESITVNADGLVTNVRLFDAVSNGDGWAAFTGTDKQRKETVILGGTGYGWYQDAPMARYDAYKEEFTVSSMESVKEDKNDQALAVLDSGTLAGLCVVEYRDNVTPPSLDYQPPVPESVDLATGSDPGLTATTDKFEAGHKTITVKGGLKPDTWYAVNLNGQTTDEEGVSKTNAQGELTIKVELLANDLTGGLPLHLEELAAADIAGKITDDYVWYYGPVEGSPVGGLFKVPNLAVIEAVRPMGKTLKLSFAPQYTKGECVAFEMTNAQGVKETIYMAANDKGVLLLTRTTWTKFASLVETTDDIQDEGGQPVVDSDIKVKTEKVGNKTAITGASGTIQQPKAYMAKLPEFFPSDDNGTELKITAWVYIDANGTEHTVGEYAEFDPAEGVYIPYFEITATGESESEFVPNTPVTVDITVKAEENGEEKDVMEAKGTVDSVEEGNVINVGKPEDGRKDATVNQDAPKVALVINGEGFTVNGVAQSTIMVAKGTKVELVIAPVKGKKITNIVTAGVGTAVANNDEAGSWTYTLDAITANTTITVVTEDVAVGPEPPESVPHAITVPVDVNGDVTVTVNGAAATEAVKDAVVTITATPKQGFEAKGVVVKGATETYPTTAGTAANTWTFTMPDEAVTVTVTFTAVVPEKPLPDAAELDVITELVDGTIQVNYYGKTRTEDEIRDAIAAKFGGTVQMKYSGSQAEITYEDGTKVTKKINTTQVKFLAVNYRGVVIGYAENNKDTLIGADVFEEGDVVIDATKAAGDKNAKTYGAPVKAGADGGVNVRTTADVFFVDAIEFTLSSGTAAVGSHTLSKGEYAVAAGSDLDITLTKPHAKVAYSQLEAKIDSKTSEILDRLLVEAGDDAEFTVQLTKDMANENGVVDIVAKPTVYRVVVEGVENPDEEDGAFYVAGSATIPGMENGAKYVIGLSDETIPVMKADRKGLLVTVSPENDAADTKKDAEEEEDGGNVYDGTVELSLAYSLPAKDLKEVATFSIYWDKEEADEAEKAAAKDKKEVAEVKNLNVAAGAFVKVVAAKANTTLASSNPDVKLTFVKKGDDGCNIYTFTMPAKEIKKNEITAGIQAVLMNAKGEAITLSDDKTAVVKLPTEKDPKDEGENVFYVGVVSGTKIGNDDPVVTWSKTSDGAAAGAANGLKYTVIDFADLPKDQKAVEKIADGSEWGIRVEAGPELAAMAATGKEDKFAAYYMVITLGDTKTILKVTIDPTIPDGKEAGLPMDYAVAYLPYVDNSEEAEVTVLLTDDTSAKSTVEIPKNVTLTFTTAKTKADDGKGVAYTVTFEKALTIYGTLDLSKEDAVKSVKFSGGVTVGKGGELTLTANAGATEKFTLDGGKLVLGEKVTKMPTLTTGSKGDLEIKGSVVETKESYLEGLWDSVLTVASEYDATSASNYTIDRNPIRLTGDGNLTDFDKKISDAIKAMNGDSEGSGDTATSVGIYGFKLTGLKTGDKIEAFRNAPNPSTPVVGVAKAYTLKDEDSGTYEVYLMQGDNVKDITFKITLKGETTSYNVVFSING